MRKRLLSALLAVIMLVMLPLVTGCGDDIETETHTEVHDKIVEQDTIVE
jgi:hypothetical protein